MVRFITVPAKAPVPRQLHEDPPKIYTDWFDHLGADAKEALKRMWLRMGVDIRTDAPSLRQWPPDPAQLDQIYWQAYVSMLVFEIQEYVDMETPDIQPDELYVGWSWASYVTERMLEGSTPVVMLTPAQQMALWFTDLPDDAELGEVAFDEDVLVLLAEPLTIYGDIAICEIVGFHFCSNERDVVAFLMRTEHSVPWLSAGYALSNLTSLIEEEAESAPDTIRAMQFAQVLRVAAYTFGLQDEAPPALRIPRAERRRRERTAERRTKNPSRVRVRYLRDHKDEMSIGEHRDTGRTMRPHLRRGHFRFVRFGSMSLPKEERPTVRRYVRPVIVNGHLGTPHELAVYRDQRAMSLDHRASSSASSSSNGSRPSPESSGSVS